ncbi:MAG: acyl-CoA thioesterase [Brachymonas sp.]|nr:acyl-CoA thioesterase [Brachymonas sp.]
MNTPAADQTITTPAPLSETHACKLERDFLDQLPPSTAQYELVLKIVPMPADCNANGDIFGGWVMSHTDVAGAVPAFRIAKGRTATVAVKEFVFRHPVRVGDILSFYASVVRVGRTSITVAVDVYAEQFTDQGRYLKVTEATIVYVAINDAGRPRHIPAE